MRSNGPSLDEIRRHEGLYELMWRLDEIYFKDMGFRSRDIQERLHKISIREHGKWITCYSGDGSEQYSLDKWRVMYSDKRHRLREHLAGVCRGKQKSIIIRKHDDKKEERNTLLHEMIHAYEAMLSNDSKEYLLIYLYRRLEKLIGRQLLDRYIDLNAHTDLSIHRHSTLFLLKSLALDRWLKLPYGTIFAYGRQEWKV